MVVEKSFEEKLKKAIPKFLKKILMTERYTLREFVESASKELEGKKVLDIGAGECQYKELFLKSKYYPTDFCKGDSKWDYTKIDFVSDCTILPIKSSSFDAVLLIQVLEHLKEPELVLKEAFRVLKQNGKLYLSAPQSWEEHQKPHDYFRFTKFGLRYLFEKTGFTVKYIKPRGGYFWFLANKLQYLTFFFKPESKNQFSKALSAIIYLPILAVFGIALPTILYFLEPLDNKKELTLGYVCECIKKQVLL